MQYQFSQSSAVMPHSMPGRVASAVGDAARAALSAFQQTWREQAPRRGEARTIEMMADIDEHTLRDIGAPNWLVAQAVERKDSHRLHLIELHRS